MGYQDNVRVGITDNWAASQGWSGLYFQDNWKLNRRLTLNLGLRYELENPVVERYDRMQNGFDMTTVAAHRGAGSGQLRNAAIRGHPGEPVNVRGGYVFASDDNRGLWNRDWTNFMPRIGMTFMVNSKTTMQAGYGIFYDNLGLTNSDSPRQPGYSRATTENISYDNGLSYPNSFADPLRIPLLQPVGNSQGLMTDVDGTARGSSATSPGTRTRSGGRSASSVRLPLGAMIRASYIGSRAVRLIVSRNSNTIPLEYLSTSPVRDQAKIDWMNATVANPFRNVSGVTGSLSTGHDDSRRKCCGRTRSTATTQWASLRATARITVSRSSSTGGSPMASASAALTRSPRRWRPVHS